MENFMVVKNLNGTLSPVCGCGDWLTHWQKYGKPSQAFTHRQQCSVVVCGQPIEVGAPVQKEVLEGMRTLGAVGDASWYVLPLCRECGQRRGVSLVVDAGCGLAPANIHETCGRKEHDDSSSMTG
jgi:hypothetical protein